MTYILNAIALGARRPLELTEGRVIADPDDPPAAFFTVGDATLAGVRYLIVTDDGSGYMSSMELVQIPVHSEQPTILMVPHELRRDLRRLLEALLEHAPENRLALYLEANRAISRADPSDPFPVHPVLIRHASLSELVSAMDCSMVEEDEVHIVENSHPR